MAATLFQVHAKAQAFVDALCRLPRSQYAFTPSGHYGRDYNTLRKLALEVLPAIDERLIGKYVSVRPGAGDREICDASFVEIETYARQILEQLAVALGRPAEQLAGLVPTGRPIVARDKAYDVEAIRREHHQAYAPWSEQDDAYLRSRFLEGATVEDLVEEFARQPGGIRSRLRRLGLDPQSCGAKSVLPESDHPAKAEAVSAPPSWRELRTRAGHAWTPEEDAQLLREFEAGAPLDEVAQSLGRGVFSVEVRLCKLGRTSGSPGVA